ncbi:MAG: Rhs element Vgr protein [Desulfobulbaceae bacterium]|nr:Rhs element Vgr protein [Desulfobulbaceae bacterium]
MTGPMTLFDTIRRIVQEEVNRVRTAELAVVEEQHPHTDDSDKDNYACTVALRDSGIVLKQVPMATQRIGIASIPAVGELVLVQFIGGDINAPIITGRLYNDEDRPPINDDNQAIMHLPLDAEDSDAVHAELHSGDSRQLIFKLGDGLELTLKDDDPVVEIKVDGGKGSVAIARDGAITIESQGDINMKGGGSINIEASGEMNIKGSVVNLN